jgi:predicted NAD/FAD-binding protein
MAMKSVAVIGSGIAGLAAAFFLSRRHRVHLFEKEARLGGHTHTVVLPPDQGGVALDTGFLVHNDRTYPQFVRLLRELAVETRASDMSFSVSAPATGLEYSGRGARGFFAQPVNWLRPRHYGLLREINRFNGEAPSLLRAPGAEAVTLGDFLDAHQFSGDFTRYYLYPLASAVWSSSFDAIREFPALTLIRFFDNHGFLALRGQPIWKVLAGGSHAYIPKLTAPFADRIVTNAGLTAVRRSPEAVTLTFNRRAPVTVDEVVFACHGDQVLPLLADPSAVEREIFRSFTTTTNETWLHTDAGWLPRRPWARAAWNYRVSPEPGAPPVVTYDLNRLQGLRTATQYCVTLNPTTPVDDSQVIGHYRYAHPRYSREAIRAQSRWAEVSGVNRTHYCGAYWFYGFHEDGLASAVRVAGALGVNW